MKNSSFLLIGKQLNMKTSAKVYHTPSQATLTLDQFSRS